MSTLHTLSQQDATTSLDLIQALSNYPKGQNSLQGGSIKLYCHYYCKLNSSHNLTFEAKQTTQPQNDAQ